MSCFRPERYEAVFVAVAEDPGGEALFCLIVVQVKVKIRILAPKIEKETSSAPAVRLRVDDGISIVPLGVDKEGVDKNLFFIALFVVFRPRHAHRIQRRFVNVVASVFNECGNAPVPDETMRGALADTRLVAAGFYDMPVVAADIDKRRGSEMCDARVAVIVRIIDVVAADIGKEPIAAPIAGALYPKASAVSVVAVKVDKSRDNLRFRAKFKLSNLRFRVFEASFGAPAYILCAPLLDYCLMPRSCCLTFRSVLVVGFYGYSLFIAFYPDHIDSEEPVHCGKTVISITQKMLFFDYIQQKTN